MFLGSTSLSAQTEPIVDRVRAQDSRASKRQAIPYCTVIISPEGVDTPLYVQLIGLSPLAAAGTVMLN